MRRHSGPRRETSLLAGRKRGVAGQKNPIVRVSEPFPGPAGGQVGVIQPDTGRSAGLFRPSLVPRNVGDAGLRDFRRDARPGHPRPRGRPESVQRRGDPGARQGDAFARSGPPVRGGEHQRAPGGQLARPPKLGERTRAERDGELATHLHPRRRDRPLGGLGGLGERQDAAPARVLAEKHAPGCLRCFHRRWNRKYCSTRVTGGPLALGSRMATTRPLNGSPFADDCLRRSGCRAS